MQLLIVKFNFIFSAIERGIFHLVYKCLYKLYLSKMH